eukprot:3811192-Heterocapsa_arctica.AAC.1
MAKVFSVEKFNAGSGVLFMIDSGTCMSPCPKKWCDWSPIVVINNRPKTLTATGKALTIYGAGR